MSQSHPTPAYTRAQELPATLAKRLVILDGAMGTMIQRFKLGEAQYRGEGYAGADGAASASRTSPDVRATTSCCR
jgi:5-methyltetrahydrofolate--homocysteine methyltransferase